MQSEQIVWGNGSAAPSLTEAQLVLVFGSTSALDDARVYPAIAEAYPRAAILSASTAGEIAGERVLDGAVVSTAVHFERSQVRGAEVVIEGKDSRRAGAELARRLDSPGLVHVFVLSDGLRVNGSELIEGLVAQLPGHVSVTGGLAGDGDRFGRTVVGCGRAPRQGVVAAVGLYGDALRISHGSLGGWDPFGPERVVTRSSGNVLYELDGKSALELYKRYLGEHAAGLPASGLLFPLAILSEAQEEGLVRTIQAVDEAEQSMTFAGDVPEGVRVRLMKANFDRLIDGAGAAARATRQRLDEAHAQLGILISCVGRRMVLKQRVEEEIEAVREVLGPQALLTGFYSYGEISPVVSEPRCQLHNQTMTITAIAEA